ncbi:unnamed protein product [Symbiodinium sp. CCMP2592]|nr:unnamed protein product [Symbiodinium sp. CCMP2592]
MRRWHCSRWTTSYKVLEFSRLRRPGARWPPTPGRHGWQWPEKPRPSTQQSHVAPAASGLP